MRGYTVTEEDIDIRGIYISMHEGIYGYERVNQ